VVYLVALQAIFFLGEPLEAIPIKPVQSVHGAKPHEAFFVLVDAGRVAVGEAVLNAEMLCLDNGWLGRKGCRILTIKARLPDSVEQEKG